MESMKKCTLPRRAVESYKRHPLSGIAGILAGAAMIVSAGLLVLYALNDTSCTTFPPGTIGGRYAPTGPSCVPAGPGAGVFVFFLMAFGLAVIVGFTRWGFLGKSWLPNGF